MRLAIMALFFFVWMSLFTIVKDDDHKVIVKHKTECNDSIVIMNPDLIPAFDCFVADCKAYEVNYDHLYCLDKICEWDLHNTQGLTDFDTDCVVIDEDLIKDSIGVKFVMYHELGHWMGLNHSEGIMKSSYSTKHDQQWVQDNWTQLVEEHFTKLKNNGSIGN